jgi:hypothetical protein
MAAPKKYGDDLRAAVHELINENGRAATELEPILRERGFNQIPPIDTMRDWARASRHTLTDRPKAQQLSHLLAGLVKATDAEITRVQAEPGNDTADQLLKLARTIREIEPLLADKPAEKNAKPSGLLGNLGHQDETPGAKPTKPATSAVRSLVA